MARISGEAQKFNISVRPYDAMPGDVVYRVKDIWTTRDGSWELSNKPGSLPQRARDAYLSSAFDDAGADHHIFGGVLRDGKMMPNFPIEFYTWQDGGNHATVPAKQRSGWANIVMWSSSRYFPDQGQRGPWAWRPAGVKADLVAGGGMPLQWHVSWFAVWAMEVASTVTPPIDPPTQPDTLEAAWVEIRKLWAIVNTWQGGK